MNMNQYGTDSLDQPDQSICASPFENERTEGRLEMLVSYDLLA